MEYTASHVDMSEETPLQYRFLQTPGHLCIYWYKAIGTIKV